MMVAVVEPALVVEKRHPAALLVPPVAPLPLPHSHTGADRIRLRREAC
jgi:hypothetical protein